MKPPGDGGDALNVGGELAGLLLSEETVDGLLETIVTLATKVVAGIDGASVSLVMRDGRHLETTDASSASVRAIDESQYETGEGPSVEAIRCSREVNVAIPARRWPRFSREAAEGGIRSVFSLPLRVQGRTTGALNLYSTGSGGLEVPAQEAARVLAGQAAVVLANAATLKSAELANRHLREALATRDVIGQAKGILMERQGIDAERAFDVMRRASQRSDRKLRDIAAEVVERAARRGDNR